MLGRVLLIIFLVSLALVISYLFFGGKKKKKKEPKKEESKGEKKVEQVIKSDKKEEKAPETKEEQKIEMPQKQADPTGFKIIRKKSEVKINKKALQNGSRNPSVTKVFDRNRKDEGSDESAKEDNKEISLKEQFVSSQEVGRFGMRDMDYSVVNEGNEFSIRNKSGEPNRAPTLSDKTTFLSHLNVDKEGNFLGVKGTGIKSEDVDSKQSNSKGINNSSKDSKRDFLRMDDDFDPFEMIRRERMQKEQDQQKQESNIDFKNLDAKTLIIADAISNPKFKSNRN